MSSLDHVTAVPCRCSRRGRRAHWRRYPSCRPGVHQASARVQHWSAGRSGRPAGARGRTAAIGTATRSERAPYLAERRRTLGARGLRKEHDREPRECDWGGDASFRQAARPHPEGHGPSVSRGLRPRKLSAWATRRSGDEPGRDSPLRGSVKPAGRGTRVIRRRRAGRRPRSGLRSAWRSRA